MNDPKININSGDEIVIVIPEDAVKDGEIEIDLDELGIDLEELGEDVNIVLQVEGEDFEDGGEFIEAELVDEDDFLDEPNEWYFDDDPYGIVYYEFPDMNDEE